MADALLEFRLAIGRVEGLFRELYEIGYAILLLDFPYDWFSNDDWNANIEPVVFVKSKFDKKQ